MLHLLLICSDGVCSTTVPAAVTPSGTKRNELICKLPAPTVPEYNDGNNVTDDLAGTVLESGSRKEELPRTFA